MSQGEVDEIIECEAVSASEEEIFYKEVGKESLRRTVPLVGEALQRLLTLETALIAGSFAVPKDLIDPCCRAIAAVLFLVALSLSMLGMLPRWNGLSFVLPQTVIDHVGRTLRWKGGFLWTSAWTLFAGLAAAVLGLVVRAMGG